MPVNDRINKRKKWSYLMKTSAYLRTVTGAVFVAMAGLVVGKTSAYLRTGAGAVFTAVS